MVKSINPNWLKNLGWDGLLLTSGSVLSKSLIDRLREIAAVTGIKRVVVTYG